MLMTGKLMLQFCPSICGGTGPGGLLVGDGVGLRVGVGSGVTETTGAREVGRTVGCAVGMEVGIGVGPDVGIGVGPDVGMGVGTGVGVGVGTGVGAGVVTSASPANLPISMALKPSQMQFAVVGIGSTQRNKFPVQAQRQTGTQLPQHLQFAPMLIDSPSALQSCPFS